MTRLAGCLLALMLPHANGAAAASDALEATFGRIDAALASLQSDVPTDAEIATLVDAMTAFEAALATLRGAVLGAQDRERTLTRELQDHQLEATRLLAALGALRRTPPPSRRSHPFGPLGAARAAILLDALTPALEREAATLAVRLADIQATRMLRQRGLDDLAAGLATLAAARDGLSAALDRREPVAVTTVDLPPDLLRDADSLSTLATRLAGIPGPDAPSSSATQPMRWPVAGHVVRAFEEPDAAGVRRPGLTIEAPPLALVTSPIDAVVRYAGPFLDYGHVVVLAPDPDTLVVLGGIATLEIRSGALLRTGDLIGLLGGRAVDAQEYLMLGNAATGETPTETLYIEVRHGQGPVDPVPLFADRNG